MATATATKAKKASVELDEVRWIATEGSILVPSERVLVVTIGLHLRSQGRWSKNWHADYGRSQQLRKRVMHALAIIDVEMVSRHLQGPPTRLTFVRLARRVLDSDNLAAVFKPIRDQTCCWLACDNTPSARANDGMRSGYTFEYRQQKQKLYGVRIEVSR